MCCTLASKNALSSLRLRAVMGGANRALLHEVPNASRITLSRLCAARCEDLVGLTGYGLVLFDSIYTHFGSSGRDNFAVQTRKVVGSLAEITQRTGTTIVGGFHPNKGGSTWSGSEEMKNVPRCLLNFAREDGPLTIIVEKANFTKPKLAATFVGYELLAMDPQHRQGRPRRARRRVAAGVSNRGSARRRRTTPQKRQGPNRQAGGGHQPRRRRRADRHRLGLRVYRVLGRILVLAR